MITARFSIKINLSHLNYGDIIIRLQSIKLKTAFLINSNTNL